MASGSCTLHHDQVARARRGPARRARRGDDARLRRATRASSSSGCTPFIATRRPPGGEMARARCARRSRGRRTRARSRRRTARRRVVLDAARRRPRRSASASSIAACARNAPFLRFASSSVTCQSGRAIASGMPGIPPPLPTSSTRSVAGERQMCGSDGERIERVVRDHALRLADRGQVVRAIPLREQREIRRELRGARRRQRDAEGGEAAVQACRAAGARAAAVMPIAGARRRAKPRFRCTSSSEIAAGVMPWMRAAWPIVSGRCWLQLLLHFGRQPAHRAVVDVLGQRARLPARGCASISSFWRSM